MIPKGFSNSTGKLLGNNTDVILPTSDNDCDLANRFGNYFIGKIQTIRETLQVHNSETGTSSSTLWADVKYSGAPLTQFYPASCDEIRKLIMKSPSKSWDLDPLPTHILKQSIDEFVPIITAMVNKSLSEVITQEVLNKQQ